MVGVETLLANVSSRVGVEDGLGATSVLPVGVAGGRLLELFFTKLTSARVGVDACQLREPLLVSASFLVGVVGAGQLKEVPRLTGFLMVSSRVGVAKPPFVFTIGSDFVGVPARFADHMASLTPLAIGLRFQKFIRGSTNKGLTNWVCDELLFMVGLSGDTDGLPRLTQVKGVGSCAGTSGEAFFPFLDGASYLIKGKDAMGLCFCSALACGGIPLPRRGISMGEMGFEQS